MPFITVATDYWVSEWAIDMLGIFYYVWTSVSLNVLVKCIQVSKIVHLQYFYAVCIMGKNYAHQQ